MKIAVIGATGQAGSLIAKKALTKGMNVTVIVRNAKRLTFEPTAILERDIFNLTPDDLTSFDAIVLAYRAPEGQETEYSNVFKHVVDLMKDNPARLIVVGGAGSLFTDETRTERYVAKIGDVPWIATPREMAKAAPILTESDVNYTLMSPADFFDAEGAETGDYTITDNVFRTNKVGKSVISYADYAAAVVQIILDGSHQHEHIGIHQN